jgi:hypothetical protein
LTPAKLINVGAGAWERAKLDIAEPQRAAAKS